MSEMDKQDLKQGAVPFFARYLEGQIDFMEEISEEETQAVVGGKGEKKRKNKLDKNDSSGNDGVVMTQKFPSDNEDSSGGNAINVTQKYPSDNEDSSGGVG